VACESKDATKIMKGTPSPVLKRILEKEGW